MTLLIIVGIMVADEYPTNVTFARLFWYVSVFAERKSNDKLRKSTEINH